MAVKVVTIGAYGFDAAGFFAALAAARVDVFCDLRLRRGMRGALYAFANSARLQQKLGELGVRYLHCKDLAPTPDARARQADQDRAQKVAKRARTELGLEFVAAYEAERLAGFDAAGFLQRLGPASVVALFCVEREPAACHRSLVAARLQSDLGLDVEHLRPWTC
jgi:hypothetical protein